MSHGSRHHHIQFLLGDKLPTTYDVAISIFGVCTNPQSQKMVEVVNRYEVALRTMWEKSFEAKHVISRPAVQGRIMKLVKEYFTKVYNQAHRKSKKKKKKKAEGEDHEKKEVPECRESIRSLNKKWRLTNNHDTLFDIGRDMDSLTGNG